MRKSPEKRSEFKVPIPNTIRDALLCPKKDDSHMSHRVKVGEAKEKGEKPVLTSDNHAFYIGKFIPFTFGEKVAKVMGWGDVNDKESDEKLYTREFLEGCLDYQFRHLAKDEKARVVVGRSLSELFNGPEDVINALSLEDEKALVRKIAKKKFKKEEDDLDIVEFEEMLDHQLLYKVLREHVDEETGVVDFPKAMETVGKAMDEVAEEHDDKNGMFLHLKLAPGSLEETRIIPEPRSLIFAKHLYDAYENDDRFRGAIDSTVPKRLRYSGSDSVAYYGLTEIAMRLSDIRSGKVIHGGADRQEKYDEKIKKIIEGKNGGYRSMKALEPLFEAMEGCSFETLHLKTEENPHEVKKKRTLAQSRIAIFVALSAAAIMGAYEFGKHVEEKEQKEKDLAIRALLKTELEDETFYFEKWAMDSKHNPEVFLGVLDDALNDLQHRYKLTPYETEEIRPIFMKYLLDNKDRVSMIHGGNIYLRVDLEDLFMQEYAIYFQSKGIEIGRPYEELYRHLPYFQELLESNEDIVVDDKDEMDKGSGALAAGLARTLKFDHIGTFYSGEGKHGNNKYEFYIYTDNDGKRHIVAKSGVKTKNSTKPVAMASIDEKIEYNEYSTERARAGIRQFIYSIRRLDALPLRQHEKLLSDIDTRVRFKNDKDMCSGKTEDVSTMKIYGIDGTYKDTFGKFEFDFGTAYAYDAETNTPKLCLLAKSPSDKEFSEERAREMWKHHKEVFDAWFNYTRGRYIEDEFLPPDNAKIKQHINNTLEVVSEVESLIGNNTNDDIKEEIRSIRRSCELIQEAMDEYDGSYKSGEEVANWVDYLERDIRKLGYLIDDLGHDIESFNFPELTE